MRRRAPCSRPCDHVLMWLFFPDQLAAFAFEDPEEAGWLWVPNALYNPCRSVALGTSDGILSGCHGHVSPLRGQTLDAALCSQGRPAE
jgi:hypothetical protein